jgi:hypothetical protein
MPEGDIETYHQGGKWHNRIEGGVDPAASTTHDTKKDAVRVGREMARDAKVEHIIKKKDGTIGERNTYGHDPRNIPG